MPFARSIARANAPNELSQPQSLGASGIHPPPVAHGIRGALTPCENRFGCFSLLAWIPKGTGSNGDFEMRNRASPVAMKATANTRHAERAGRGDPPSVARFESSAAG